MNYEVKQSVYGLKNTLIKGKLILIKNVESLELLKKVNAVILDKTETI
jgi:cation transport ATPase